MLKEKLLQLVNVTKQRKDKAMPIGKGTYGSKRGRPPMKKKKKKAKKKK